MSVKSILKNAYAIDKPYKEIHCKKNFSKQN